MKAMTVPSWTMSGPPTSQNPNLIKHLMLEPDNTRHAQRSYVCAPNGPSCFCNTLYQEQGFNVVADVASVHFQIPLHVMQSYNI